VSHSKPQISISSELKLPLGSTASPRSAGILPYYYGDSENSVSGPLAVFGFWVWNSKFGMGRERNTCVVSW